MSKNRPKKWSKKWTKKIAHFWSIFDEKKKILISGSSEKSERVFSRETIPIFDAISEKPTRIFLIKIPRKTLFLNTFEIIFFWKHERDFSRETIPIFQKKEIIFVHHFVQKPWIFENRPKTAKSVTFWHLQVFFQKNKGLFSGR